LRQRLDILELDTEAVHDVDLARLDELAHGGWHLHHPDDHAVDVGAFPASPVVLIAFQDDAGRGVRLGHDVGTGAGAFGVEPHPGIAEVALLLVGHRHLDVDDLRPVGCSHGRLEQR
jgi:hypothetical protein